MLGQILKALWTFSFSSKRNKRVNLFFCSVHFHHPFQVLLGKRFCRVGQLVWATVDVLLVAGLENTWISICHSCTPTHKCTQISHSPSWAASLLSQLLVKYSWAFWRLASSEVLTTIGYLEWIREIKLTANYFCKAISLKYLLLPFLCHP